MPGQCSRQQAIADALSKLAEARQKQSESRRSGHVAGMEAPGCFVKISEPQEDLDCDLRIRVARLAGLEPAARCLEGTFGP